MLWDKAGELVMLDAARRAAPACPGAPPIHLYKNNTDNKGASYGAHENYLMRRATPFADIVRHLTPFFVSRQVVCGAGRVGIGQDGREHGFQISQRADYFEVEVGLETTLKRPIINTRDEPHADPEKYRRLHVIIGDANLSEISTYLKVGTTALVLAMIEDRFLTRDLGGRAPGRARCAQVSHDPTLHAPGHAARRPPADRRPAADGVPRAGPQVRRRTATATTSTRRPRTCWPAGSRCSTRLETDPMLCATRAGLGGQAARCSSGYRDRDGLDWDDAKLQLIDLQYADVRPEKGLYHRLVGMGRMERLLDDAEIERAVHEPPEDTRAYFRGRCLEQYADRSPPRPGTR